jgi:cob(I)alamin adenosyltransferase
MKIGLIHIYTGDGKGKTTAALGLLLRAAGRGMRAVLAQFLKGRDTGELHSLAHIPGITVIRGERDLGFFSSASPESKEEMTRQNNAILIEAHRLAREGLCDLLVLDELCAAYRLGCLDTALADKLVLAKPPELELVITGRNPPERFIEAADYITECIKRKHPYERGIAAREGLEF